MNKTSFRTEWENPTLMQVANGSTSFTAKQHVIQLPQANQWVSFVVHLPFTQDHPMYLHGHDFLILASGYGDFDSSSITQSSLVNAPRRDIAMLPASGYLAIAFRTDNPGAWLMHCRIAWHTSEGFAVQILERKSEISIDRTQLHSTCINWNKYVAAKDVGQHDSGV